MASPSLLPLPLFLALLLLPCSSSSAASFRAKVDLIRSLNHIPHESVTQSTTANDDAAVKRIVQSSFKFPGLVGTDAEAGTSIADLGHHAGYYEIAHSHAARMFYYFFESRGNRTTDPVVLWWLTGGLGCSGSLALFYENGPFRIGDDMSLTWNDYGWAKVHAVPASHNPFSLICNIIFFFSFPILDRCNRRSRTSSIYVDQPTGTGFSYGSNRRNFRHDESGVSKDLYDFLQALLRRAPAIRWERLLRDRRVRAAFRRPTIRGGWQLKRRRGMGALRREP